MKTNTLPLVFALMSALLTLPASASENCRTVPFHQCVLEIPRGTWVWIDQDFSPAAGRTLITKVIPLPAFLSEGESATLLGAKFNTLTACSNYYAEHPANPHHYYATPDLAVGLPVPESTPSHLEGCNEFLKRNPHAIRCETGWTIRCGADQ